MKRTIASSLFVASLAASLSMASAPLLAQASPDPAKVPAGSYVLDSKHTLVQFTVDHMGISEFFGTFPGATGTLSLDPKNLRAAKLDVSVPVATVSTTNARLDSELVAADWFDAAQFPNIRFVSTKVVKTGASTADITGNLTLHGVTKPVTFKATFKAAGQNQMKKVFTVGFNAVTTIKRIDFGISKYPAVISDNTQIRITAAFEKQ